MPKIQDIKVVLKKREDTIERRNKFIIQDFKNEQMIIGDIKDCNQGLLKGGETLTRNKVSTMFAANINDYY